METLFIGISKLVVSGLVLIFLFMIFDILNSKVHKITVAFIAFLVFSYIAYVLQKDFHIAFYRNSVLTSFVFIVAITVLSLKIVPLSKTDAILKALVFLVLWWLALEPALILKNYNPHTHIILPQNLTTQLASIQQYDKTNKTSELTADIRKMKYASLIIFKQLKQLLYWFSSQNAYRNSRTVQMIYADGLLQCVCAMSKVAKELGEVLNNSEIEYAISSNTNIDLQNFLKNMQLIIDEAEVVKNSQLKDGFANIISIGQGENISHQLLHLNALLVEHNITLYEKIADIQTLVASYYVDNSQQIDRRLNHGEEKEISRYLAELFEDYYQQSFTISFLDEKEKMLTSEDINLSNQDVVYLLTQSNIKPSYAITNITSHSLMLTNMLTFKIKGSISSNTTITLLTYNNQPVSCVITSSYFPLTDEQDIHIKIMNNYESTNNIIDRLILEFFKPKDISSNLYNTYRETDRFRSRSYQKGKEKLSILYLEGYQRDEYNYLKSFIKRGSFRLLFAFVRDNKCLWSDWKHRR